MHPEEVRALAGRWGAWAERVGVHVHPRKGDAPDAPKVEGVVAPAENSAA